MIFIALEDFSKQAKAQHLYDNYNRIMYKIAYEILGDHHLAEDALHESFIRVIKNLHKIDENNCPHTRSFLVIICRNVAINILNERRKVTNVSFSEEYLGADEKTPLDITISRESVSKISEIINSLPTIYRDTLLLKSAYGLNNKEISQSIGVSEETVKKRLLRGRAMLLEKMRKEESKNEK